MFTKTNWLITRAVYLTALFSIFCSSFISAQEIITNGNFATLPPVSAGDLAPGTDLGSWESGVPCAPTGTYPIDTRVSVQQGNITYSGGVVEQRSFPGDPAFGVPASNNYLYSNGNSTGAPYIAWQQTVTGLKPNTLYQFLCYTSNAIDPTRNNIAPTDPVLTFTKNGTAIPGGTFTIYKDADPLSGHGGVDIWDRRLIFFRTGAAETSVTLAIQDDALGNNGDDWVFTAVSLQEAPQLTITKRLESPVVLQQGNTARVRYILSVSNAPGAATAYGVRITDNLAAMGTGISFTGAVFANLDGGASGGANNSGSATNVNFGDFILPGGSNVEINFEVEFNSTVLAGTYNNSVQTLFIDPSSSTGALVSPGGTYSDGTTVGGSNYDGASSTAEDVRVTATNAPPVATNNAYTAQQSVTVYGNIITDNSGNGIDSDPDGGLIRINTNTALSPVGSGTLVLAPTGQFSFTSAPGFVTAATGPRNVTFSYTIIDVNGSVSNTATVTITVNPMPDNDGDGVADITDLDDDNDGILDVTEAGNFCSTNSVIGNTNLILNGDFSQGAPLSLTPVPTFIPPGSPWGGGFWTSGVAYTGYNVYPADTRIAVQRGTVTYFPSGDPGGFRIIQGPFLGDAPFSVPPSPTYLYSNGNSLGTQYVICRQTVNGLVPGRKYILVSYTSNAINPALDNPNAPDDGIMQFYADGQPVGEAFVVYKDGDPRSGHGGADLWDRRQVIFQATAGSSVFELRDAQLGVNGDDFVITYAGVFPYNDFACGGLPADPSGDEDNDGIPNWRDTQFGTLNANGIAQQFAVLDPDGDGVISQFDLDSDGDGCFDAIESGQTSVTNATITSRGGTLPPPYGNNGLASIVELFSTTGGQPVEAGTLNYNVVQTTGTFNFLNATIFTACSPNAPVAQNIIRTIRRNTTANPSSYTFPASDFQGAFSDADGNTLQSIVIVTLPANGTLTYQGNPLTSLPAGGLEIPVVQISQLVFTPTVNDPAASPYTSFQFKVRDNSGVYSVSPSTFTFNTIDILAVDDLPSNTPITSIVVGASSSIDVLDNDTRVTGNNVSLVLVSQSNACFTVTPVNNGTTAPTFNVTVGAGCAIGTYTFVYQFRDVPSGLLSNQATVTFDVTNPPPPLPSPVSKTIIVRVNTAATPSTYTFSQSPGFGGTPDFAITGGTPPLQSIIITALPLAADGVLTLNGVPVVTGVPILVSQIPNLVFTPAVDRAGPANPTIQYLAVDAVATSITSGTITFIIIKANDDVNPSNLSAINVLANDFTASGTITVRIVNQPACGSVTVNADNTITYTPDPNGCASGTYNFDYVFDVTLLDGTVITSNPANVRFDLTAPVLVNTPYSVTTAINTPRPFALTDFPVASGSPAVTDVVIETLPVTGTLLFNGNPVTAGQAIPVGQLANLVFSPAANTSGVPYTTFTFTLRDNGAESPVATMTVNVIEARPDGTAAAPAAQIAPGLTGTVNVITNDIRTASPFTLSAPITPSSNCFTATPNNASGTYTINVAGCAVGTYTFNYTFTQNGVTSNQATVTFAVLPPTPVLNPNASVAVTFPEDNDRDPGVKVNFADPAAIIDFENKVKAAYSSPVSPITAVRINALPARGQLLFNNVPVTVGQDIPFAQLSQLVFRPAANENGNAYTTFTVRAINSAGVSADALTVTINITPVNDKPVASDDSYVTNVNIPLPADPTRNVLSNDSDAIDGNSPTSLTPTLLAPPAGSVGQTIAGGTITLNANGTFLYTPPSSTFFGRDSVQYQVCDSGTPATTPALCDTAYIKIRVNAPPTLPPGVTAVGDTIVNPNKDGTTAANLKSVSIKPLVAYDSDGVIANYTILTIPNASTGTLLVGAAPVTAGQVLTPAQITQLRFRPADGYSGQANFDYRATDNDGGNSVALTYQLRVINLPVAVDDRAVVIPNTSNIPIRPYRNDSDPDQNTFAPGFSQLDTASVRILEGPSNGTATVSNGVISYTPNDRFTGKDSIVYIICDRTPDAFEYLTPDDQKRTGKLCDTAVIRIDVRKPFVPEGFSPNGDNNHDYFVIENPYNEPIELKIFNRWGNLVYESSNFKQDEQVYDANGDLPGFSTYQSEWSGKTNRGLRIGEDLPDGTYFYIVKFKNSGFSQTRFLTLMR